MSKFNPDFYSRYRVAYPKELFYPLRRVLSCLKKPINVIDLGAGTGISSQSLMEAIPLEFEITLVDSDPEMLALARGAFKTVVLSAESFQGDGRANLVLVGSAWHWFDQTTCLKNLEAATQPGSVLYVFEYQFPKSPENVSLNEWVRRSFNSEWRTPNQAPRGSLRELTQCIRLSNEWFQIQEVSVNAQVAHSAEDFAGVIFSQSRYLDFESRLNREARAANRTKTLAELLLHWGTSVNLPFDYHFQAYMFRRRIL